MSFVANWEERHNYKLLKVTIWKFALIDYYNFSCNICNFYTIKRSVIHSDEQIVRISVNLSSNLNYSEPKECFCKEHCHRIFFKNKLRFCKKRSVTMLSDSQFVYLIVMETWNNEKVDFVVLIGSLWTYQLTSDNVKNLFKLCLEGNVLV